MKKDPAACGHAMCFNSCIPILTDVNQTIILRHGYSFIVVNVPLNSANQPTAGSCFATADVLCSWEVGSLVAQIAINSSSCWMSLCRRCIVVDSKLVCIYAALD